MKKINDLKMNNNMLLEIKNILINNLPEDICINICEILRIIKLKDKVNIKINEIYNKQNVILKETKSKTGGYVIIQGIYYDNDMLKFYNEIKFKMMNKRIVNSN